uniref:Uncharacterized protein n=1 Tax=Globisporangium ultimum (strain ATCC 200006 / CBS 805.95 / DAOM BR144) TaxID=431595 RepID=K3WY41_GLOUD
MPTDGFVAFVCLILFAHHSDFAVDHLNDISETLSVMPFLVQITMIGCGVNKKMRIRSPKYMTYTSELLITVGTVVSVKALLGFPFL